METLIDDDNCRVEVDRTALQTAERLVVTFAGIGPGRHPRGVPIPEFIGTASRYGAAISVADKNRSWGNSLNVSDISQRIVDLAAGRPIFTLGNSMGGFLAVLFSTPLRASRTVAVAAQYSVHPVISPSERRWRNFIDAIDSWWYPSLSGHFNSVTKYITLNGSIPQERRHWLKFPVQSNAQHYIFDTLGHNVAAHLKEIGSLPKVLDGAFLGEFGHDMTQAGPIEPPAQLIRPRPRSPSALAH